MTASDAPARSERSFVLMALLLSALIGLVDAIGFLAFGRIFLASPEPTNTILGVSVAGAESLSVFVFSVLISFVGGVVLVTLLTSHLRRFRRTTALAATTLGLLAALTVLAIGIGLFPALILAAAMGAAQCVFAHDNPQIQESMLPGVQITRLAQALSTPRGLGGSGILLPILFWVAFLAGGMTGAFGWARFGSQALSFAGGLAAMLTGLSWLIERKQ